MWKLLYLIHHAARFHASQKNSSFHYARHFELMTIDTDNEENKETKKAVIVLAMDLVQVGCVHYTYDVSTKENRSRSAEEQDHLKDWSTEWLTEWKRAKTTIIIHLFLNSFSTSFPIVPSYRQMHADHS